MALLFYFLFVKLLCCFDFLRCIEVKMKYLKNAEANSTRTHVFFANAQNDKVKPKNDSSLRYTTHAFLYFKIDL